MRISQCKWDWVLHTWTAFEYVHLMEKVRIMVVRYSINYAGQWDHLGKGQLVVLTSSLEPECGLKMGDTIDLDARASPLSGIPVEWK